MTSINHPAWCARSSEQAECDFHAGRIVELEATGGVHRGFVAVTPGGTGDTRFVDLWTTDKNAISGPVDLTLDEAEELAAQLIAAVARLRGVDAAPDVMEEFPDRATLAAGRAALQAQCGATAWGEEHPFEADTQVPDRWGYLAWETCGQPADALIHRVEGLDVPEVTS